MTEVQYRSPLNVKQFIDRLESNLNIDVINTFRELSKFKYDEDISRIDTSSIEVYYITNSVTGCIDAIYTKLGDRVTSCDVSSPDIVFDISSNTVYNYTKTSEEVEVHTRND